MRRIICVLCTLTITVALLTYTAYGAVIDSVDFDMDGTQLITVKGTLKYGVNNRLLAIAVDYPSDEDINGGSGYDISASAHIGQTFVDFDGAYSYSFLLEGPSGIYKITVSDGTETGTAQVRFAQKDAILSFIKSIDNDDANSDGIKDKEDIRLIIENEQDASIREMLSQYYDIGQKDIVLTRLNDNRPFELSFAKFLSVINDAAILYEINSAKTTDELLALLDKYQQDIGFNYDNPTFKGADDKSRQKILSSLLGMEFTQVSDINTSFEEICFSKELTEAYLWQSVEAVLKAYMQYTGIDFTDYDKLSDRSAVCKQFLGKSFTFKDAKKFFEAAVEEALKNEKQQNKGSLGGGSRSSSGGGTSAGFQNTAAAKQEYRHPFTDVGNVLWAEEALNYLSLKNIISGTGQGKFEPMATVTREQFVKMLVCALGQDDATSDVSFNDTNRNEWHYKYIAAAVNSGIVKGKSPELFGVGENITRQDMAVLVYRAITRSGSIADKYDDAGFSDDALMDDYAFEAIYTLRGAGVVSGKSGNEFKPKETATRAEAAQIIYNMMKYLGR